MFHQLLSDRTRTRSSPELAHNASPSKPLPLLHFPTEIRLQILGYLVRADPWKLCPHTRLPLMVTTPDFKDAKTQPAEPVLFFSHPPRSQGWPRPKPTRIAHPQPERVHGTSQFTLSVLCVNRQLYQEALEILYSENVFYLEHYFSWVPRRHPFVWTVSPMLPPNLGNIPRKHLHLVRKIAFSVTDRTALEPDFRLWRDFLYWVQEELVGLQHTLIFLFGSTKPSQVFLARFPRLLDSIPGTKTIEFRGSNSQKKMVGNNLKEVFRHRSKDALTIKVLGGCYCQCWTEPSPASRVIRNFINWTPNLSTLHCRDACWTQPDTLWPWLSEWSEKKATNAAEGSITPKFCFNHKGPIVGCLLCHKWTECVHDKRSRPGRINPDGIARRAS
ncbi:MAG: hypothetical protein LQ348_004721 [Seirophora lacunosa]|nr:MAG: hypothetical protein LQ344_005086 [Seirophora lacunosa]KAI4183195.1 MAG: hypothetical protein LQ348_004721 [Seirophora lacunosa]